MQMQRQIRTNFDAFFNQHSGSGGMRMETPADEKRNKRTPMLFDLIELY